MKRKIERYIPVGSESIVDAEYSKYIPKNNKNLSEMSIEELLLEKERLAVLDNKKEMHLKRLADIGVYLILRKKVI